MAVLHVKPTRMELNRLKKRLVTSRRGHKLLKDKRDDMIKKFMALINEAIELRRELEHKIRPMYESFAAAVCIMGEISVRQALMFSVKEPLADTGKMIGSYPYAYAFTSPELDDAVDGMRNVLPVMMQLADLEKKLFFMAEEIEKTRRRVNALEYVQIPDLQETVRHIMMKLDEDERSNLARTMKIKDMMMAERLTK